MPGSRSFGVDAWHAEAPVFTETVLSLDLASIRPCIAGPRKRPEDRRVDLSAGADVAFARGITSSEFGKSSGGTRRGARCRPTATGSDFGLQDGAMW